MAVVLNLWLGEPEVGLWCPKCNLPSGYRVPIYTVSEQGVSATGHVQKCHDCKGPL